MHVLRDWVKVDEETMSNVFWSGLLPGGSVPNETPWQRAARNSRSWAATTTQRRSRRKGGRRGGMMIKKRRIKRRKFLSYLFFFSFLKWRAGMKEEEATIYTTALWRVYRGWMLCRQLVFNGETDTRPMLTRTPLSSDDATVKKKKNEFLLLLIRLFVQTVG